MILKKITVTTVTEEFDIPDEFLNNTLPTLMKTVAEVVKIMGDAKAQQERRYYNPKNFRKEVENEDN